MKLHYFLISLLFIAAFFSTNVSAAGIETIDSGDVVGVIQDENGNTVETVTRNSIYISGDEPYLLQPGQKFRSYQYYVSSAFAAGFYFSPETDANRMVKIRIEKASAVGNNETLVLERSFSTSESNNIASPYYFNETDGPGGYSGIVLDPLIDTTKPYYRATFTNTSSNPLNICLFIGAD